MALDFEKSWHNIFQYYKILEKIKKDGHFDISADMIKRVEHKEPRLLTKIDYKDQLPTIMKEHDLAILAIKNGLYRIAKFDPFIPIQEEIATPIIQVNPPKLLTIDPFNITTESAALDISAASGILDSLFGQKCVLSIRGRMRGSLRFSLDSVDFDVNGVQIEVDGGYEGASSINLIEAKIGYKKTISIRQLLYPYLYWKQATKNKKSIKNYLLLYQGDIFRYIPYIYDGRKGYLDHDNEKAFQFIQPQSKHFSLYTIQVNENVVDTHIPFPQADRLEKVYDMFVLIGKSLFITKEELRANFDIVPRQIDYYFNVLRWMQLCEIQEDQITLSPQGQKLVPLSYLEKLEKMATIIFSEPICNNILHNRPIPAALWQRYNIKSEKTKKRRIQTIRAWIAFFTKIFDKE